MSGSNTTNQLGSYGMRGQSSSGNTPGARWGHAMAMFPTTQETFLTFGFGYSEVGAPGMFLYYSDRLRLEKVH